MARDAFCSVAVQAAPRSVLKQLGDRPLINPIRELSCWKLILEMKFHACCDCVVWGKNKALYRESELYVDEKSASSRSELTYNFFPGGIRDETCIRQLILTLIAVEWARGSQRRPTNAAIAIGAAETLQPLNIRAVSSQRLSSTTPTPRRCTLEPPYYIYKHCYFSLIVEALPCRLGCRLIIAGDSDSIIITAIIILYLRSVAVFLLSKLIGCHRVRSIGLREAELAVTLVGKALA